MSKKIEDLIKQHEGSKLEFKENIDSIDKILATIVAFANGSGGTLLIGVSDKERNIVGVKDVKKAEEILTNKISSIIEPRIYFEIEILPYRSMYVILIEICSSITRPHFIKGNKQKEKQTYIRIGSSTRAADSELIKVIERSISPKSFDEELCYDVKCEDIKFTDVTQLFEHKRVLKTNDLVTLGIFAENAKTPTNGGVILFAINRLKYFPWAFIKAGIFDGINKSRILDTQQFTSFLPNAIDETLNYIKKNTRVSLVIKEVRHQKLLDDIPLVALREAIINAVVHTDYSISGTPITVSIFDDRIEIENNAVLLGALTLEDLKVGGISKLRNPVIGRIFNEIGLIEQWGSGIGRMIQACHEVGLEPPHFDAIGGRIKVTFHRQKTREEAIVIDINDRFIIELLAFCGSLSAHQIAQVMDISRRTVIMKLNRLKEKGDIIEIAQSKNDPKKKYTIRGDSTKIREKNIVKLFWHHFPDDSNEYLILRIKLGIKEIRFIFDMDIIDDNYLFFDYNNKESCRDDWKDKALEQMKDLLVSEPILGIAIVESHEEIYKAFKEGNFAEVHVLQRHCLRDFRR
ncbi:MAG: HTH domain-containing protein [Alphaproteobacteria bacterium]|jgi:ATP-dependent DNA helicase RecG|nr:HTH domain-containing protein [Alphaproteobacteria bacterium]